MKKIKVIIIVFCMLVATLVIVPSSASLYGTSLKGSSDDYAYPDPYLNMPKKPGPFTNPFWIGNNNGEFLVPDEYNLASDPNGYSFKWYVKDYWVMQSFVPDCNKIGAFGIPFLSSGKSEHMNMLPDFTFGLYPATSDGEPDLENPVKNSYGQDAEWKNLDYTYADGWLGFGFEPIKHEYNGHVHYMFSWNSDPNLPDWAAQIVKVEDMNQVPQYWNVIHGEKYFIGVCLQGDSPRYNDPRFGGGWDCALGYYWDISMSDVYSKGCKCAFDVDYCYSPYTKYYEYPDKDFKFYVDGWDYSPEIAINPGPEDDAVKPLEKRLLPSLSDQISSNEDHHNSSASQSEFGVTLSAYIEDQDDEYVDVYFYDAGTDGNYIPPDETQTHKDVNIDPTDDTLIGVRRVRSGTTASIFWPGLIYSGDIHYRWYVIVRDWGLQRGYNVWSFRTLPYDEGDDLEENMPPCVGNIPDQTISLGESFNQIDLDLYVDDKDNLPSEMTWEYSGNSDLTIGIKDRVVTITYPDCWIGSETITFTVYDSQGQSDSDTATLFTVEEICTEPTEDPPQDPKQPPEEQLDEPVTLYEIFFSLQNEEIKLAEAVQQIISLIIKKLSI